MGDELSLVIAEDGVFVNDLFVDSQLPSTEYDRVLRNGSRVHEYGPPAPAGHANNKALIFDAHGIYLFVHHSTGLVRGIAVIYVCEGWPFSIETPFHERLTILGFPIPSKPTLNDIPSEIIQNGTRFNNVYNIRLKNLGLSIEETGDRRRIRTVEVTFYRR